MNYLVLMLLVAITLALDKPFERLSFVRQVGYKEMQEALKDPSHLTIQVMYRLDEADFPHNLELEEILEKVEADFPLFYDYIAYDCTYDQVRCPEIETRVDFEGILQSRQDSHAFPKVVMHIPDGLNTFNGKPMVHTSGFQSHANEKLIRQLLDENMPFLGEKLTNDEDSEDFEDQKLNRVILFWTKDTVPGWYKALSSKYKGRLSFGFVGSTNRPTHFKKHGVSKYPALLGLRGSDDVPYEGEYNYHDVDKFVSTLAHERIEKVVFRKPAAHDENKFYFAEVNQQPTYEDKWKMFKDKQKKVKRKYSKPESWDEEDL